MKLERTLEQYANCTASGVAGGSKAQMMYFVEDAKKDIATLATALAAKDAEIATLKDGIKRLADEEELCAETTGDDPFSLVYTASKLAAIEAENDQMAGIIEDRHAEIAKLREALRTVLASLIATTSLIIRAEDEKCKPSKAAASDAMFAQMLKDYDAATIEGRTALAGGSDAAL